MNGRRSFLMGLGASILAGPAIVRAGAIMPISSPIIEVMHFYGGLYVEPGREGRWFGRTSGGFAPFDLLEFFQENAFIPTGPVTRRVRVVDYESLADQRDAP